MSFAAAATLACFATVAAGLAATQHHELRAFRWLKIAVSLPLVVLIASVFDEMSGAGGWFALWPVALLGFIWKSPLAHLASAGVSRLIYGDLNRSTGIRAEFGGPKALLQHGDLEDALRVTLQELEKEPRNYEGGLLLSEIHQAMDQPKLAAKALERLLGSGGLTADQKHTVSARLAGIEDRLLIAALNQR